MRKCAKTGTVLFLQDRNRIRTTKPLKKEVHHFCEDFHAANFVSSLMLAWRAVSNAVMVTPDEREPMLPTSLGVLAPLGRREPPSSTRPNPKSKIQNQKFSLGDRDPNRVRSAIASIRHANNDVIAATISVSMLLLNRHTDLLRNSARAVTKGPPVRIFLCSQKLEFG